MSSIEFLRPTIHSRFLYSKSNYNHLYLRGASFCHNRFRAFQRSTHHFVPSSIAFPSVNLSRNQQKFTLRRGLLYSGQNFRDFKVLATSQDGESSEKSESEGQSQSPSQSPASTGSSTNPRKEKRNKSGGFWWSKGKKFQWQPIIQAQEIGVLLLQLGIVMFVMRLLRPGIPLPGSEPRTPTTFVSVPYSEFLTKINSNQVAKVEVDGVHIMFKLKNDGSNHESEVTSNKFQESESLLKSMTPTKRIVFTTTRPTDIKTPYEKMLDNQVEFGSPDKRSGGFLNSALVSSGSQIFCLFEVVGENIYAMHGRY